MPFVPMSKQQQEQNNQNQPVNISGGGGASFSDVVPGQEPKQKSSGQYANLQSYIAANQPQALQMGQKVAQQVEQSGQQAEQKLQQFDANKPQQVQAFDPNQYIQNAPRLSQEEVQSYQQKRQTGGYTGPQQLEQVQGFTEAQQAARQASDKARMAGTESGQQDLLRQTFQRPDYTQGQAKLDQVLLGGNQQARQSLSDLSQRFSGLYDVFNQKAETAGQAINQANQQALTNRQAFLNAENQAWTDLLNPIEQRAMQANIERPQVQQRIQEDISDDLLLQDTLQRLGLSQGQNLFDLNLASYITPNQTQLGINDVAQASEREKYQALANLFGDQTRNQISTQGQNLDAVTFNRQAFDRDVAARNQEYQQALDNNVVYRGMTARQADTLYKALQAADPNLLTPDLEVMYRDIVRGSVQDPMFRNMLLNDLPIVLNNFNKNFNPNRVVGVQS